MKEIKDKMHDCGIAFNHDSRTADIKKYVDKLASIEEEFEEQKKLNGDLDATDSEYQEEILELIKEIEKDMDQFNEQKDKFKKDLA